MSLFGSSILRSHLAGPSLQLLPFCLTMGRASDLLKQLEGGEEGGGGEDAGETA